MRGIEEKDEKLNSHRSLCRFPSSGFAKGILVCCSDAYIYRVLPPSLLSVREGEYREAKQSISISWINYWVMDMQMAATPRQGWERGRGRKSRLKDMVYRYVWENMEIPAAGFLHVWVLRKS